MERKKLGVLLALAGIAIPGVFALWAASHQVTITANLAGGVQGETEICDLTFSQSQQNGTCTFHNQDSSIRMNYTADTSGLVSTDGRCTYQNGQDVNVEVSDNGADWFVPESKTFNWGSGDHTLYIRAIQNQYACPTSGIITLSGSLV